MVLGAHEVDIMVICGMLYFRAQVPISRAVWCCFFSKHVSCIFICMSVAFSCLLFSFACIFLQEKKNHIYGRVQLRPPRDFRGGRRRGLSPLRGGPILPHAAPAGKGFRGSIYQILIRNLEVLSLMLDKKAIIAQFGSLPAIL